ncbi:RNA-directed DNA polymerase [Nostoc sp. HG1]|nr:RNA-directed DNA polymerase [Nostoc sp. HG1]
MINIDFTTIEEISQIEIAFGCSIGFIQTVLDKPSLFYDQLQIPKKGRGQKGKYRIVYKVEDELNLLQKNIATVINSKISFPEYVQGFVSKRSIATNASLHLSKKYVLNIDIKDFFDTIHQQQVCEVFKNLGCVDKIADVFAQLCTFNQHLVQGSSTSPVLANLVCQELDEAFVDLAKQYNCSYSRYADDITFSGEKTPGKKEIKRCLKNYGFELNSNKWKSQSRGRSQYVTGLTVFDTTMPRISKSLKRILRQILYYASKYGLENHLNRVHDFNHKNMRYDIKTIDGLIAFMYSVEPNRALQLDMEWQRILNAQEAEQAESSSRKGKRNPEVIFARRSKL